MGAAALCARPRPAVEVRGDGGWMQGRLIAMAVDCGAAGEGVRRAVGCGAADVQGRWGREDGERSTARGRSTCATRECVGWPSGAGGDER